MHRTSAQTKAVCSTVALRAKGKDWLVVWSIFFPYIGNNHPKWLIFFRGVETTNQKTISILVATEIGIIMGTMGIQWISASTMRMNQLFGCVMVCLENGAIDPKDGPGNVPRGFWDLVTGMGQNLCDHTWGDYLITIHNSQLFWCFSVLGSWPISMNHLFLSFSIC